MKQNWIFKNYKESAIAISVGEAAECRLCVCVYSFTGSCCQRRKAMKSFRIWTILLPAVAEDEATAVAVEVAKLFLAHKKFQTTTKRQTNTTCRIALLLPDLNCF